MSTAACSAVEDDGSASVWAAVVRFAAAGLSAMPWRFARRARSKPDCSPLPERALLLSQANCADEQPCSPLPSSRPLPPLSTSRRGLVALLLPLALRLLLLLALLYLVLPSCLVWDGHARWHLLQARLLTAHSYVMEVVNELTWDTTLLLSWGSRMRACQLDTDVPAAFHQLHPRYTDALAAHSDDGQSYEVSTAPPLSFDPGYHPTPSSPHTRARLLTCATSTHRCDVAVVQLFKEDLIAEMNSSSRNGNESGQHSSPHSLCTSFPSNSSSPCEDWPFQERSPSASKKEGASVCGSGVVNVQEARHDWAYRHPLSCMRLVRSIGREHAYCVGRDAQVDEARVLFHMVMFGSQWRDQATLAVASFLVTQNLTQSHLLIWTDRPWSGMVGVAEMDAILAAYPSHVELRVWNGHEELLRSNSLLSASADWYASIDDSRGWLRGDMMRLLLLHNYGGVYYDADVLLLRDLAPLLGQQFAYKWGSHCDEINGAVMRLFRGSQLSSRFLDALYHTPPVLNSRAWGNDLYVNLHEAQRRSLAGQSPPLQPTVASLRSEHFTVLPACFFNSNWMEPALWSPLLHPELPALWPGLWQGPFAYHLHGEVWDDKDFAARDPSYLHVAATIRSLLHTNTPHGPS